MRPSMKQWLVLSQIDMSTETSHLWLVTHQFSDHHQFDSSFNQQRRMSSVYFPTTLHKPIYNENNA